MRAPLLPLPHTVDIDVARLARAFNDTTQCYKFLFFRALLDRFAQSGERQIAFTDILAGMIEAAWWPVMNYRLTIGVGQNAHLMRELVESMAQDADERLGLADVRIFAAQTAAARVGAEISRGVLRYVPFRFLKPWLEGVRDGQINSYVVELTDEDAESLNLPYRLSDRRTIEIGVAWAEYFNCNMPILRAWADLHWLDWMQARNPNIGVSLEKLGPPADRQSLAQQTAFLKAALEANPHCIFTGEEVRLDRIALDHFLPRSYVGHDRIWNLVPIAPAANSRKGARLPYPAAIDRLADFHSLANRDRRPQPCASLATLPRRICLRS
jgi:hypothetical protein